MSVNKYKQINNIFEDPATGVAFLLNRVIVRLKTGNTNNILKVLDELLILVRNTNSNPEIKYLALKILLKSIILIEQDKLKEATQVLNLLLK